MRYSDINSPMDWLFAVIAACFLGVFIVIGLVVLLFVSIFSPKAAEEILEEFYSEINRR